jgi:hypothetical protein
MDLLELVGCVLGALPCSSFIDHFNVRVYHNRALNQSDGIAAALMIVVRLMRN